MPVNKNRPWSRLIAESLAIIASILVAFAIDAWWQDRQERKDERQYVSSLRQEFSAELESLLDKEICTKAQEE
jgi:hypothetical protein